MRECFFGSHSVPPAHDNVLGVLTMIITAILLHVIAVDRWRWRPSAALAVTATFLAIDVTFFSANLLKVSQGGWLPIVIGISLFTLMTTWKTGRRIVAERLTARAFPLEAFVTAVRAAPPTRVPGTAIFMTAQPTGTPAALVHNLHYNKMLHEHVVVLTVATVPTPHARGDERLTVRSLGAAIYHAKIQYGFMEDPDVPEVMGELRRAGVPVDENDLTFFLGRETIVVGRRPGMATWREKLFVLMSRNAVRATAFFKLPPERVVELGVQVEM
jgi:KUP system potassium uptake protein